MAAADPWSPWPCAFSPASVPCSSPSFSCPPRPIVLSAATWPWLLQTIFVLSFHQLLTSGLAGTPCPTGAHQSSLTPKASSPFSVSGTTCQSPLTCLTPGPSASLSPPCPTPLPSSFPPGIWTHLESLWAWTEMSSSTGKLYLLLCHLRTLPYPGHVPLAFPIEVLGSQWKSTGVPACGSSSLVRLFPIGLPNAKVKTGTGCPFCMVGPCFAFC